MEETVIKLKWNRILKLLNCKDNTVFNLKSPYELYIDIENGYPYSGDGRILEDYVKECFVKAVEYYRVLSFGEDILLIYDDYYGINGENETEFIESCLTDGFKMYEYSFVWQEASERELDRKEIEAYTCKRRVYNALKIDFDKLFMEIIKADIGGGYQLASAVSLADAESGTIFQLYDDRGIRLLAKDEKNLKY